MSARLQTVPSASARHELYKSVRSRTTSLVSGLCPEDMMLQSMEDASPAKWHLAHTTWFFEEFILKPHVAGYASPDERFAFLFNSYYVQAGPPAYAIKARSDLAARRRRGCCLSQSC